MFHRNSNEIKPRDNIDIENASENPIKEGSKIDSIQHKKRNNDHQKRERKSNPINSNVERNKHRPRRYKPHNDY